MLDRDLAEMYGITTGNLNKAVKRNIKRFPLDFMFQLTTEEFLIFQNGTSSWGGVRKLPFAFTEQGLAMLSGILNSDIAIEVNINIMRAFVYIRNLVLNPQNNSLEQRMESIEECLNDILSDQNDINEDTRLQIELINETLAELQADKVKNDISRNPIGFKIGK